MTPWLALLHTAGITRTGAAKWTLAAIAILTTALALAAGANEIGKAVYYG